ncbi:membrane hypothetical protein [Candidatus Zixiibacteriota bacterium]|nr:membrane hypothetical protein [candidate division Zixibacteria bacterium]
MGDPFKNKTGKPKTVVSECKLLDKCPVRKAMDLHASFLQAVAALEERNRTHGSYLEMAYFVKQVAEQTIAGGKSKKDVWKEFRPKSSGSTPQKYEDTLLYAEIDKREKQAKKLKDAIDQECGKLVDYLADKKFQQHLLNYHKNIEISPDIAQEVYGIEPGGKRAKGGAKNRELDHIIAVLTEGLSVSTKGQEFLDKVADDSWVQSHVAFADIWGYMSQVNSITDPVGKFFSNVAPIIGIRAGEMIRSGQAKSVQAVLNDAKISKTLTFLKKKLKIDFAAYLEKRSDFFVARATAKRDFLQSYKNIQKEIAGWSAEGGAAFDPHFAQKIEKIEGRAYLDNAWIGLTLDSVTLTISVVGIASDLKKAGFKDYVGAIRDLSGLAKTIGETVEARMKYTGATISIKSAQTFIRVTGVIGCLAQAVLYTADIIGGAQSGDADIVILNSMGLALTAYGAYAIIVASSLHTGIFAILGIALAILMALILDPKIIDYLEDTFWGEHNKFKIAETKNEYYKLFEVKVEFIFEEFDSNQSYIQVESDLLADDSAVAVEIVHKGSGNTLGVKMAYPNHKDIDGKGIVQKDDFSWWQGRSSTYSKRIRILKAWDIWSGIVRDGNTPYDILAGSDPKISQMKKVSEMVLHDTKTAKFPQPQKPKLLTTFAGGNGAFNVNYTHREPPSTYYIAYPSGGKFGLKVYSMYGDNCKVDIFGFDSGFFGRKQIVEISKAAIKGKETLVMMSLPAPAADDYYKLEFDVVLYDSAGAKVESKFQYAVTRIAGNEYAKKLDPV